MPFYEFKCSHCGTGWDLFRPMKERDDPARCPDCAKPGRRVFSPLHLMWFPDQTRSHFKEKHRPPQ